MTFQDVLNDSFTMHPPTGPITPGKYIFYRDAWTTEDDPYQRYVRRFEVDMTTNDTADDCEIVSRLMLVYPKELISYQGGGGPDKDPVSEWEPTTEDTNATDWNKETIAIPA